MNGKRLRALGLVSTWMGDRLGIPGAVSFCFCFSFTGQLTHFSKLQHSCVLLYPFNLIAASFFFFFSLFVTSLFFLLSVWQKTAQPLRSSFLLQGAIDRLFLSTTWEMYPLRFQVQISRIQRQNKFSSSRFSDVGDWSKITCKWTNQIFSFFSYFVGTWKQDKRFISSKKFNEITIKVRANIYFIYLFIFYLFIYLLFFLGMAFLFFL